MYLTSIKRHYLLNKALKKAKLQEKYLHLLYTIYLLQPCGYYTIDITLTKVRRRHNGEMMRDYLKYLVCNNYIVKDQNKYSLTPAGLSLLKEIENKLRKERYDK